MDERIGAGAMGEVWKGFDLRLRRKVAIKVLPEHLSGETRRVERFQSEARIGAALQHPGIAVVFDADSHQGRLFFVMELLPGADLADTLRHARNGLPVERVMRISQRLADALAAAHAKNVIHRDIKPANIILMPRDHPKICDFGIARIVNLSNARVTAGVGTAEYMAPEQFIGRADERADLYSLGCVMYEMTTGDQPFIGSPQELMYQHVHAEPEPPTAIRAGIPQELEELILKLMAKKPRERPQKAHEVVERLKELRRRGQQEIVADVATPTLPVRVISSHLPAEDIAENGLFVKGGDQGSMNLIRVLGERGDNVINDPLVVGLGRDDEGKPLIANLAILRHLLIAGTAKWGVTSPVELILGSVLTGARPEQVRMVVVDSAAALLAPFTEAMIPYEVESAVRTPDAALQAIDWTLTELDRRYEDLAGAECRSVHQYNEEVRAGRISMSQSALGAAQEAHPPLLLIIAELAEPMRAAKERVEHALGRLAQTGRAVGVHVILQTEHPDQLTITGRVKAHIPARLGLPMATAEESVRVLDHVGAESLRAGEALFRASATDLPQRIRLAHASAEEIAVHFGA
ncbi:protein kinase domain-containing protein [Nonomuraea sp. NPDC001684]